MSEFVMPSLGADMTAGTLIGWMKKVGDTVKRGDIIAEVDTDKGVIEIEVFSDGTIEKLLIKPGTKVPVGTALAIIRDDSKTAAGVIAEPAKAVTEAPRLRVSPAARKLAQELRIDLSRIKGSGPQGRIQREDVERAERGEISAPEGPKEVPAEDRSARMRRAIAAAMARSKKEIPHYYLSTTIDFTTALDWLERENAKRAIKDRILYGVLLIKAVALALRKTPELNGTWESDRLKMNPQINIGVAISLRGGGLIAPAIHETDTKSLDELMKELRDLVARTRAGALRSSELSDSTITITNLGEQGVENVFGIIYPPQVALVGFGKIVERALVVDAEIKKRSTINASLSADHRASDGHRGGIFLSAIERILQDPEKL
jgi:pyruvate dehydrogenase E2 component (dihydrolipoamide acetyltransferase)